MLRAERIPVDSLRAHPRNPRKITPARLAALERVLAADPQMLEARPLIALADGTLIAGNQRWRAARSLRDAGDDRFETVPTIHVDLEPERATEWALRDNEGFGVRDDQSCTTVVREDRPHASADHPTTKPVALVQRQLVNSSIPGAVVYDPFGGSGSTLLAAERTGRRARLMEIDPVYVDVIRQRFADYTDQPELAP
jgi:DNA methylase